MNGDPTDAAPAPEQNKIVKAVDGDEPKNKEVEEEEEEKGSDQSGDLMKKQEGEEDAGDLRPKLAEGFYEIEAVRRKRVRKGQVQYLIKWRGWPETANTWEPYENLQALNDIIEAFEESLRTGKHRSRKRKRRSNGPVPQAKKKRQGNAASTKDTGNVKIDEGNSVIHSLDDQNHEDNDRSRMEDINNNEGMEQGNENGSVIIPPQVEEREYHNEMEANLVKSTDGPSPNEGPNRLPVDTLESKALEVICFANEHDKVGGEGLVLSGILENGNEKIGGEGLNQAGAIENENEKVGGEGLVQSGALEKGNEKVGGEGLVIAGVLENRNEKVGGEGLVQAGALENGNEKVGGEGLVQAGALEIENEKVGGEGLVQAGVLGNGHENVSIEGLVQAVGLENGHHKVGREVVVQGDCSENGHHKVDGEVLVQGNSIGNGHQLVEGEGVMQAGARMGSRKRKPTSVKRFNREKTSCVTNYAELAPTTKNTRSGEMVAQNRDQISVHRSNDLACKNTSDDITDAPSITEIVKPISFSSSESVPEILVTFMAKRSDGKEVMVDNKYLKANNPLLLINYYEQHLNYNTPTGPPRPERDSTV